MSTIIKSCTLTILAAAMAQAATINTTISVNASGTVNLIGATTISGTAAFTNANIGSGMVVATVTPNASTGNFDATFTIAFTGSSDTLAGKLSLSETAVLSGQQLSNVPVTITGGSGTYANATGSFSVSGSGSLSTTGTTITVQFTGPGTITTGSSTTPPTTPAITAVLDAGSYTPNIAQGSIFVVKGSNLSSAGLGTNGLLQFSFPLPTNSNGVSIAFTPAAGGAPTNAYLVYLYNQGSTNQLAAILPSTLAAGNYNVSVTNNGATSAPVVVAVVAHKPEMVTLDGSGSGLAVVQNYVSSSEVDIDLYTTGVVNQTTVSPAYPGQTLIAWLTGLGPITTPDNQGAPVLDMTAMDSVQVIVGGQTITPVFAGRAPNLAGEDQIDFTLPMNVTTGCAVPLQIVSGGATSVTTYIAIAPNSTAGACVQPGLTPSQLQSLENGTPLVVGNFGLEQFSIATTIPGTGPVTAKVDSANGAFTEYAAAQLASYQNFITPTNSCIVTTTTAATPSILPSGGTNLDAGAVTLSGPTGSGLTNLALPETNNTYSLSIGTELPGGVSVPGLQNSGTIVPGTYTLSGAGGKDVGKFTASMTLGSPLTITLPATVNRSQSLALNWTGGASTDLVTIVGSSSGAAGGTTQFVCSTTAGAQNFTVPQSVLGQLPASTTSASGGPSGFIGVLSSTAPNSSSGLFMAPLTAGGSVNGAFVGLIGTASNASYQ